MARNNEHERVYLAASLLEIISKSRRITGHRPLPEDELIKTADAWAEVLKGFTPDQCDRAFERVMRTRADRGPLQPVELARTMSRSSGAQHTPAAEVLSDPIHCPHCQGVGYQFICETKHGLEYTQVRPCSCANCPSDQRKTYPLTEPEWQRDHRGYWRHVPSMFTYLEGNE